jgi:hypothetical protein
LTLFGWVPGVLFACYVLHPIKDPTTLVVEHHHNVGAVNGIARDVNAV